MKKKVISNEEFAKIARLARLQLNPDQTERLSEKFNEIIEFVQQLDRFDTSKVDAMSHVHGNNNVFRPDVVEPSLDPEVVKEIAPDTSGRFIRVPIIIDQEGGDA